MAPLDRRQDKTPPRGSPHNVMQDTAQGRRTAHQVPDPCQWAGFLAPVPHDAAHLLLNITTHTHSPAMWLVCGDQVREWEHRAQLCAHTSEMRVSSGILFVEVAGLERGSETAAMGHDERARQLVPINRYRLLLFHERTAP